jgi:hypothetical protein
MIADVLCVRSIEVVHILDAKAHRRSPERIADTAIALPPSKSVLARDLISRTLIAKQLAG